MSMAAQDRSRALATLAVERDARLNNAEKKAKKTEAASADFLRLALRIRTTSQVETKVDPQYVVDMAFIKDKNWKYFTNQLKRIEKELKKAGADKIALNDKLKQIIEEAQRYCDIKKKYNQFKDSKNYVTYLVELDNYRRLLPPAPLLPLPTVAQPPEPFTPKLPSPPPSPAKSGCAPTDLRFNQAETTDLENDIGNQLALTQHIGAQIQRSHAMGEPELRARLLGDSSTTEEKHPGLSTASEKDKLAEVQGKTKEVIGVVGSGIKIVVGEETTARADEQADELDNHQKKFAKIHKNESSCWKAFISCWSSMFSCKKEEKVVAGQTYQLLPGGPGGPSGSTPKPGKS